MDKEALRGDAGLAIVLGAGLERGVERLFEVGGWHDNEGVGSAKLQQGGLDALAGRGRNRAACRT